MKQNGSHKNPSINDFELTTEMLIDVAMAFKEKVRAGLIRDNTQIKCLPTFIAPGKDPPHGTAYVLDLGGSNLRAAIVSFDHGKQAFLKGPQKKAMPWKRNVALPKDEFLKIQAELLALLEYPEKCVMGYCFSYPAISTIHRDAILLNWTKGITVFQTRGKRIGKMLLQYLRQHYGQVNISRISVINDTVASLFAGLIKSPVDASIGLVAGTGANMAAFMDAAFIPKVSKKMKGKVAVNLESGNFTPPHLTRYDESVDAGSENRGLQRFEKAVSGLYLSRIFRAVFPDSSLNPDSGALGLIRMCDPAAHPSPDHVKTAKKIYIRSARMTAAALAGLIAVLSEQQPICRVRVVAEGALFHGHLDSQTRYSSIVDATCNELLEPLGLPPMTILFSRIKQANLVGTAIAALS